MAALTITPMKPITIGASYSSNLAASDALSEVIMDLDGDSENDNISSVVGAVLNWSFFNNAYLAVEYLREEFQDDFQKTDTITAQLAVEF